LSLINEIEVMKELDHPCIM